MAKRAKKAVKKAAKAASDAAKDVEDAAREARDAPSHAANEGSRAAERAVAAAGAKVEQAIDLAGRDAAGVVSKAAMDAAQAAAKATRDAANEMARARDSAGDLSRRAARLPPLLRRKFTDAANDAAEAAEDLADDAEAFAESLANEAARTAGLAVDWVTDELVKRARELYEWLVANIADLLMDRPNIIKVEQNDDGRAVTGEPVYYVNGVLTTIEDAKRDAEKLAGKVDRPVWIIHNPTMKTRPTGGHPAFPDDLTEAVYDRTWPVMFGAAVANAIQLGLTSLSGNPKALQLNPTTRQITYLLYHARGNISLVSQSQGCLIVRNASLTAALFRGTNWTHSHFAWVATGAPLGNSEVWPKPKKFRSIVVEGDFVAQIIGLQGGAGTLEKVSGASHDFQRMYVEKIQSNMLLE